MNGFHGQILLLEPVWDERGRAVRDAPVAFFETGLLSTDGTTGRDGARPLRPEHPPHSLTG
ncbi:hypothetical protein [Streptomyces sp. NPDC101165]|uniref:hypothetical protein n=1 Tax=Streptomyces sp. NPDC101165 TaxID=3366119 RepID=UPI00382982ED